MSNNDIKKPRMDPILPRPLDLTDPAVIQELEERILIGETPTSICSDPQMPSLQSFYKLLESGTETGMRLQRARMAAQEAEIDKTIDIADSAKIHNWQVAMLRIKTRQWRAAKLNPRRYGEQVNIDAKAQAQIVTRVQIINDPQLDVKQSESRSDEGDNVSDPSQGSETDI